MAETQPSVAREDPVPHEQAEAAPSARADTAYFLPFQRIPIPVHSMGPDARLIEVNEAWVTYTGYDRSQAIGRSFGEFLEPASAARYRMKAVPELIADVPVNESRSVEYRLVKASGETADVVLTARPERDPLTGRFLHSLTVISDITARNRAEAALRQTQKLEALGRLTGGVAHDFNNLLMIIQGSLQLLARRLPVEDRRAARLLDAALQGTTRGAALTMRLLAFARQQELTPGPLNPRKVVAALHPMVTQLLGADIRMEEDLPAGLWNLCADPGQLELALLNLAANARDAMPAGGRLNLAARNASVSTNGSSFIGVTGDPVTAAGDYVVLSMSDTGVGMDEASLARAADPFFTTKGPGKGTGLGLSMVHGFALQSGGALRLSSRLGAGTTVELWLPRTEEQEPQSTVDGAATDVAETPAGQRLRILLVDDDPLVIASTTDLLEELGHSAITAVASAEAALALLQQSDSYDLLLTDHMMPGMSGAQLAVRARALRPSLPILIASGFAELEGLAGVQWPRLRKPYSLNDLATALRNVTAQAGEARASNPASIRA